MSMPSSYRCNRLRCPLARMSGLQCFNMGHNGINLYGVSMTPMENLHAGGQSSLGHLSLVHRDIDGPDNHYITELCILFRLVLNKDIYGGISNHCII